MHSESIASSVGYARVLSVDTSDVVSKAVGRLTLAGVSADRVWVDQVSCPSDGLPALDALLRMVEPGTTLFLLRLAHLGLTVAEIVARCVELHERRIAIVVCNGISRFSEKNSSWLNLDLSELATDCRDAISHLRHESRVGRKPALSQRDIEYVVRMIQQNNRSVFEIALDLRVSKSTVLRYVSPDGTIRARKRRSLTAEEPLYRSAENGG